MFKPEDMEIITTKNITLDDKLCEAFKDFTDKNALSPLTLNDMKKVFCHDDKVVILSGEGDSLKDAVENIKKELGWFNPIAAKHIALFVSVKSEKISKVINTIDIFKESLKYTESFKWGFTINQNQNCDYVVYIASAGIINEDEIISLDLDVMDNNINVNVMRRYMDSLNKASNVINKKYSYYKNKYDGSKSNAYICLYTIIDIVMHSMDADVG